MTEHLIGLLKQQEKRDQKMCNAEQLAIIRSPMVSLIREAVAGLIKGSPVVEMNSDFAKRNSKFIITGSSWNVEEEIKANVIVTAPEHIADWIREFELVGVKDVVVIEKPRDVKVLKQKAVIENTQVILVTAKRTRDLLSTLSQTATMAIDPSERVSLHKLNDLLATRGDLSEEQLKEMNVLRSKLVYVLQQISNGEPTTLVQRKRVITGMMPQRVIYDLPVSTVDTRRIYAKMTWLTHFQGNRTTRDHISIELDYQLHGIAAATITADFFKSAWALIRDRCILQQSIKYFKPSGEDVFLRRYIPRATMQDSLQSDDAIVSLMPSAAVIANAEQLPQHYNRFTQSDRDLFAQTVKNCVSILGQEERSQCMICIANPSKCRAVFCCCCFVTCAPCLMRIAMSGRSDGNQARCPQCRTNVLRSQVAGQEMITVALILQEGQVIDRPLLESEEDIVKTIRESVPMNQYYATLTQFLQEEQPAIGKHVDQVLVMVTLDDLLNASRELQCPIESAYPDAVVKVCSQVCAATMKTNLVIKFQHVMVKTNRTYNLSFPYYPQIGQQ